MTPGGLGCGVSVDSGGESLRVGGEISSLANTMLNSPTEVLSHNLPQQVFVSLQIVWPSWAASVHVRYARRPCGRVG
jgi:hypothetical protein